MASFPLFCPALGASVRALGFVAALSLAGCGGGEPGTGCAPEILINEYAREELESGGQRVQVELQQRARCTADVPELSVEMAQGSATVPAARWGQDEVRVLQLSLREPLQQCQGCGSIRLRRRSDGWLLDEVAVPLALAAPQHAGRTDARGPMVLLSPAQASLGAPNPPVGPVGKLADLTGFRPRDSSSNASVTFNGRHWVLGGWSNFAHDVWYSVADVWASPDGIRWEGVNTSPPHSPYSAFVVFDRRIWAIAERSYSTSDGVVWQEESLTLDRLDRAVVFKGSIVSVGRRGVQRSDDGRTWTPLLTRDQLPWGPDRREPHLLVHDDRLWLIGGTDEPADEPLRYTNDVWSSEDGIRWQRVVERSAWSPRRWSNAASYDNKLWIFNGANFSLWPEHSGNVADIWYSSGGSEWYPLDFGTLWSPRHASFLMHAPDGALLLSSGYGNGGVSDMSSDVWRFKLKLFFPKATGSLSDVGTWGSNTDGSGRNPARLDDVDAVFVLRNRSEFKLAEPFAGHTIVAGDGIHPVTVHIAADQPERLRLYAAPRSLLLVCGKQAKVQYSSPGSEVRCLP